MFLLQPSDIPAPLLLHIAFQAQLLIDACTLELQSLGLFLNCCRRSFKGVNRIAEFVFEDRPRCAEVWVAENRLKSAGVFKLEVSVSD